jgi:glucose/arabinose dehydrogenase
MGRHLRLLLRTVFLAATLLVVGPAPIPAGATPTAPAGYYVVPWATGLDKPTSLTWGPDGWLWVTCLDGPILALRNEDGAGGADTTVVFADGLVWPLGLAHFGGSVYVGSLNRLTKFTDTDGDHVADVTTLITDQIPSGKHWTTDVAVGPDNLLYVGVGSQTNRGQSTHPWASSILKFHPTNGFVGIHAGGFRNPYGLAFHGDGSLFGTDNGAGSDSLWNCHEAEDELNWIRPNGNFGFPACTGSGSCADVSEYCTPAPCGAGDCQQFGGCDGSMTAPTLILDPHSSSDGLCFGRGFKGFDGNDLFIAQFGQQESHPDCFTNFGHKVIRTRLTKTGVVWTASAPQDFLTNIGRPLDVSIGPDSALYVADFAIGTIWRVFHTSTEVGVPEDGRPDAGAPPAIGFRLTPNPAPGAVRLEWSRPPSSPVDVFVSDIGGRLVRGLGSFAPAAAIAWDGRDARGHRAPPGLYVITARNGRSSAAARVMLVE